jgi:hypothetical protein
MPVRSVQCNDNQFGGITSCGMCDVWWGCFGRECFFDALDDREHFSSGA